MQTWEVTAWIVVYRLRWKQAVDCINDCDEILDIIEMKQNNVLIIFNL